MQLPLTASVRASMFSLPQGGSIIFPLSFALFKDHYIGLVTGRH